MTPVIRIPIRHHSTAPLPLSIFALICGLQRKPVLKTNARFALFRNGFQQFKNDACP